MAMPSPRLVSDVLRCTCTLMLDCSSLTLPRCEFADETDREDWMAMPSQPRPRLACNVLRCTLMLGCSSSSSSSSSSSFGVVVVGRDGSRCRLTIRWKDDGRCRLVVRLPLSWTGAGVSSTAFEEAIFDDDENGSV